MSETFGFPKRNSLAEKVSAIPRAPSPDPLPATDAVDTAAARHGFVSREPEVTLQAGQDSRSGRDTAHAGTSSSGDTIPAFLR